MRSSPTRRRRSTPPRRPERSPRIKPHSSSQTCRHAWRRRWIRLVRSPAGVLPSSNRLAPPADGAGLARSGTVPVWVLKLTAIATVLNVFFFGFGYARANVKDVAAPLQPPVLTTASTRATPAPTPAPALTLRRGVRTTTTAPLT